MKLEFKEVETIPEFIDAIRIRANVFIKEQGFEPGWEPDEDDKTSRHFIALADDQIVATVRFREFSPKEIKIERMACKKEFRGKGISKNLAEFLIKEIKKLKPKKIWLKSQVRSQQFYEKCGFKAKTKPFDMWGCPHVDMEYEP